jgi:hypothetical protein
MISSSAGEISPASTRMMTARVLPEVAAGRGAREGERVRRSRLDGHARAARSHRGAEVNGCAGEAPTCALSALSSQTTGPTAVSRATSSRDKFLGCAQLWYYPEVWPSTCAASSLT